MGAWTAVHGARTDDEAMMRSVAANWLSSQKPDGFLPYGFDFLKGEATDDDVPRAYIAREAGAIWTWARAYERTHDERHREPLQRAIAALGKRSLPLGKPRFQATLEALRIYDAPFGRLTLVAALKRLGLLFDDHGRGRIVSAGGTYDTWTGATALALLAELTYSRASGDERFAPLRAGWLDALLALHVSGGGFRESPLSIDESDFSNGEAWLALAVYADRFPGDVRAALVLNDVDRAFIERYARRPSNPFFQWGAMAAVQRWRTTRDAKFTAYLGRQAAVFADRFEHQLDPTANTCPAMEGVAALLAVLSATKGYDAEVGARLRAILAHQRGRLPRWQIAAGQARLPLGKGASLDAPELASYAGAFLLGDYLPEVRVDASAHCLSLLLLADEMEEATATAVASPVKQ